MHGSYDLPPGDLSGFDSGGRVGLYCAAMANALRDLISDFAAKLTSLVQSEALARARDQVTAVLGIRRRDRPAGGSASIIGRKPRKKGPKQLCPVPGCKNPAAPVFGMVCAKHKDVPKAKIKKYREARRAKKRK
jgi:hypothetical protein